MSTLSHGTLYWCRESKIRSCHLLDEENRARWYGSAAGLEVRLVRSSSRYCLVISSGVTPKSMSDTKMLGQQDDTRLENDIDRKPSIKPRRCSPTRCFASGVNAL
jgi:hypothetical protein